MVAIGSYGLGVAKRRLRTCSLTPNSAGAVCNVFAARALAQIAAARGVEKLYAITVSDNMVSMLGLTSAGLRSYSRAYRLIVRDRLRFVCRGHRMPLYLLLGLFDGRRWIRREWGRFNSDVQQIRLGQP